MTGCTQSLCQQRTGVSTFGKESRRQGLASLLEAQELFNNKIKHNVNRPFILNVSILSHTYNIRGVEMEEGSIEFQLDALICVNSICSACLFVCSFSVVLLNANMAGRHDHSSY